MSPILRRLQAFVLVLCWLSGYAQAQRGEGTLHVQLGKAEVPISAQTPLVVWLTPLHRATLPPAPAHVFQMRQKDKEFVPHLLVVPVGSTVEFPNLDPFFHNVFSQFNGRRFDLGLYETGRSQQVKLLREGVSYIFCNIHPQMGGVIISLATPYFTVSPVPEAILRNVLPGFYQLNVWTEHGTAESLAAASRNVTVVAGEAAPVIISLHLSPTTERRHANKFGDAYPFETPSPR